MNARYGRDPGFSFYTHLSDQLGPYSSIVMSATNHEAPYVLDGLLHHGTQLVIGTHYTGTGGASDHVFILCAMLGIRFCPRLRDLPDRRLACIEPAGRYPDLQPLMGRRIKAEVVREHWAEAVCLAASLYAGTVAPSVMLKKLAAYRRQNQLDLALQELGRIERTLFTLDWLESPELRRRCHAGLNKSEQRHYLAQEICTFNQGRIADRGTEAQQFRASGLNLVIAAIVYWNSTYIADAVAHLRAREELTDALLGAHHAPDLGAHRILGGFSVGARRRGRRQEAAAQSEPHAAGSRVMLAVRGKFDLSVVRLYQPKTAAPGAGTQGSAAHYEDAGPRRRPKTGACGRRCSGRRSQSPGRGRPVGARGASGAEREC